jgi:hypothetical protein
MFSSNRESVDPKVDVSLPPSLLSNLNLTVIFRQNVPPPSPPSPALEGEEEPTPQEDGAQLGTLMEITMDEAANQ